MPAMKYVDPPALRLKRSRLQRQHRPKLASTRYRQSSLKIALFLVVTMQAPGRQACRYRRPLSTTLWQFLPGRCRGFLVSSRATPMTVTSFASWKVGQAYWALACHFADNRCHKAQSIKLEAGLMPGQRGELGGGVEKGSIHAQPSTVGCGTGTTISYATFG